MIRTGNGSTAEQAAQNPLGLVGPARQDLYIESEFSIIPVELDLDPFLKATPDENKAIISMLFHDRYCSGMYDPFVASVSISDIFFVSIIPL